MNKEQSEKILQLIVDIGCGRCSLTEDQIISKSDDPYHEILIGLLMLHEDLEFQKEQTSLSTNQLKQSEEKHFETANELQKILNTATQGYWRIDNDAKTVEVNLSMAKILGVSPEEAIGTSVYDYLNKEQQALHRSYIKKREDGVSDTYELSLTNLNGKEVPCIFSATPLYGMTGEKIGSFALVNDITEYKASQLALEQSAREAERANQAKSEFLSSMSHELRTPLNAILGFTQLMQFDPSTPLTEDQKDCTDQVIKGGNHLLELIDQVLELAKIEAGKMTVSIEPISVRELLDEGTVMMQTMAEKRSITINASADDCPDVEVMADHTRIKQVLLNLLSNAVKYNNEGGSVSIAVRQSDDKTLHIAVTDTGPGIPQDQHDGVFQPFNRLGHETSEIEGTGIGLVISREIMHVMKGEIGFESEVGKGSTFWIEIPLAVQASKPATEAIQAQDDTTPVTTIGAEGQRFTVLYVEDNPSNLKLMEQIIAGIPNIELTSTHNAELGIEMAEAEKPDLILMDINLPGMDGYEALERLKINDETSSIPVIAVTAQATKSEITRGRHAGFARYVTKPIQVSELIKTIKETLESV